MSGSGGGGPRPVGSRQVGLGGQSPNCDELRFETNLASPVEEVVERLDVGDELAVSLERGVYPRVVTWFEDAEVGSIIERLSDLIHCLQMGSSFHAIVREVDDGIVRVEVQPE